MEAPSGPTRRPWTDRASAGFALAALVLLTVAVVAPEIGAFAGNGARASAIADCNAIGVALRVALSDAADTVADHDGTHAQWLFGPGVLPRGGAWSNDTGLPISAVLVTNAQSRKGWRGPYLRSVPIDPWARAYVVALDPGHARRSIVIVSAGPDGIVQSCAADRRIVGDDVGIVLHP